MGQKIIQWLFPLLSQWLLKRAAKAFREKYPPEIHAKKSRKYMWDNVYRHWRQRADASKNKVDDIASEFGYYYVAGYIEDGTLDAILIVAEESLKAEKPNRTAALMQIRRARKMIGMP